MCRCSARIGISTVIDWTNRRIITGSCRPACDGLSYRDNQRKYFSADLAGITDRTRMREAKFLGGFATFLLRSSETAPASLSAAVPDAALPPPSMESYRPHPCRCAPRAGRPMLPPASEPKLQTDRIYVERRRLAEGFDGVFIHVKAHGEVGCDPEPQADAHIVTSLGLVVDHVVIREVVDDARVRESHQANP